MREVVVLGVGMTFFDKQPDKGLGELGEEAIFYVFKDAEVEGTCMNMELSLDILRV